MSLLRSTKFVRYFTGAARTLILNTAKTAEANLLVNPKALGSVNNVLMRDYATKKTESLEPLLQKLDSEVRRFGRIAKRDIDEVFDEIKTRNDITSSQSLLVIRCCGELVPEELPEQRTLLVQKIWGVLTERGIPMDISHYNALLRVYLENEHPFSPAKFLEEIERKGLQANRVTYQRLMWRYCQEGDVDGATKVLEKMRELSLPVSEPVLNALVMGHAFHGDTEGAKAVLETMAGAGLQPTNRTYTLLACGYAKQGDVEGIENVIRTATDKDVYLSDKDILDIIEHLALGGHGDKADKLFCHLHKTSGYNSEVYNLVLRLINKGHEDTAKMIMKTMAKAENFEDTPFKGAFFVKQLLRLNKKPEELIKSCRQLMEEGLVPNALFIATEGALALGQTELSQKLFKELEKDGLEIRQHYYWPLLAHKGKEGDEEGLLQIVREMAGGGMMPTGEALRDYVIPYLIKNGAEENVIVKLQIALVPVHHSARNLMVELLDKGNIKKAAEIAVQYRPRGQYSLVARPLLNALSKTKDINSFTSILHVISSPQTTQNDEVAPQDEIQSDDIIDRSEIGRIVRSATKILVKPDLNEKLLAAVNLKGLKISTECAQDIEQYLGESMSTQLSELLSQLTSGDVELAPIMSPRRDTLRTSGEIEMNLKQAKSKGGDNVSRFQRQLISAYIRENKVDKLKSFMDDLKLENFDFSTGILAQMLEFYCENDELERAKECYAKIVATDSEFALNKFKLIQMAYAFVRAKQYAEAEKFLIDHKPKDEFDNKTFVYNSKCWQLVNSLAEAKDVDKVKQFTKLLIDNGYVEPSNVILGPSIKVHLLKDDLENALKEFEHCCKTYRCTPWKGELMKALIMKEDATKLQWMSDLSTQIHGEVNILHDLVLAFIECGRLRQARRILETPGLAARTKRLHHACQRYLDEGQSVHLEGLLEATKELSHIDRSDIFYHLLITYCQANETDKALGLWTILQEEGEVPSEVFLNALGKHLKSQNREIPFVMPDNQITSTPKPQNIRRETQRIDKTALPTKLDVTNRIEELVKSGKAAQAMDVALKSIDQEVMPKPTVLKFLLKNLAEEGNVEKIELFGKRIKESMRRKVTYDDKLTLAIFKKGAGSQHIDSLLTAVNEATTDEALEMALIKFPRSNALASVINDENMITKCLNIAEKAISKGHRTPINLLWMEFILAGKEKEADSLWNQYLKDSDSIFFRRLLQESHVRNAPLLMEKLLSALSSNKNMTIGSLGNVYSRLINLYLMQENFDDALSAYERAVKQGVGASHFNKNCITRLKAVAHNKGIEMKEPV